MCKDKIPEDIATTFPLDYDTMCKFLQETYKCTYKQVPQLAGNYTTNKNALIVMLQETYKVIQDTNIKCRLTKVIKQLNNVKFELTEDSSSVEEN